jgi:hypothetical protein
MKNAILTFDYEVFLGRETGNIEKSVINPVNSVLQIFRENNARAVFFVDAAWLLFIKEKFMSDYEKVESQLKEIVASGSSVELHLHPQWINASVKGNNIVFDSDSNYRLHSLNNEEILNLFEQSINLLSSITGEKINCFRAGGWCIEPFSQIKAAFDKYNIKNDFSVAPGLFLNEGEIFDFDYSKAPDLPFYKFEENTQKPVPSGKYTEVTVSTYLNNPVYRLINKILLKIAKDKIFGDGKGIKEKSVNSLGSWYRRMMFSSAMLTTDKIYNLLFKFLVNSHFRRHDLLVVVSHPKTLSAEGLKNIHYMCENFRTMNSHDLDTFLNHDKLINN